MASLISSRPTTPSPLTRTLATTEGTESFVSAKITARIGVRADYTVTRAIDVGTGLQLLRRPKEKWSATETWLPINPLMLSATVLHVSDWLDITRDGSASGIVAPGYTIVNLRGNYAISDQVKIFGRVDNLFNLHYQNRFGVFGGIRVASYGVK
jgi:vitamin B12 transporter